MIVTRINSFLIQQQALRLSQSALGETAPGKVVNLLSNDVSRFDFVTLFMNTLWSAPLLVLIVGGLLFQEFGWAGVIGILLVCTIAPLQSKLKYYIFFHEFNITIHSFIHIDLRHHCKNVIKISF